MWTGNRAASEELIGVTPPGWIVPNLRTRPVYRLLSSAALLLLSFAMPAGAGEPPVPIDVSLGVALPMPQREREFVDFLAESRRQYEAAEPGPARKDIRLAMQVRMARFVTERADVDGWSGIVQASQTSPQGDRWISIEIAPGVTVATCENRLHDPDLVTLIEPHSPLYRVVDELKVGQPVLFSATILKGRFSADDDMVEHPRVIARFSSLKPSQ